MIEVTEKEYREAFSKQKLKPISSFSDPDGVLPFGYGVPAMDTDWGVKYTDKPIARCEMRKESRHDTAWEYRYFLNDS